MKSTKERVLKYAELLRENPAGAEAYLQSESADDEKFASIVSLQKTLSSAFCERLKEEQSRAAATLASKVRDTVQWACVVSSKEVLDYVLTSATRTAEKATHSFMATLADDCP